MLPAKFDRVVLATMCVASSRLKRRVRSPRPFLGRHADEREAGLALARLYEEVHPHRNRHSRPPQLPNGRRWRQVDAEQHKRRQHQRPGDRHFCRPRRAPRQVPAASAVRERRSQHSDDRHAARQHAGRRCRGHGRRQEARQCRHLAAAGRRAQADAGRRVRVAGSVRPAARQARHRRLPEFH